MISQDKIDLIEKYLKHELGETDQTSLERDLTKDTELSAEFARRETAHMAMDFMIAENLRSDLRKMEGQQGNIVSMGSRRRKLYPLAIAASLVILIGAFFMIQGGGSDPSTLAASHYSAPDFTFRSGNDNIPGEITAGLQALTDKDYATAIELFSDIEDESPFKVLATYYRAHGHYSAHEYTAAQSLFEQVAAVGDMRYTEDAQWYSLLSCMAQGKSCAASLDQIRNDSQHTYYNSAQEISEELK